MRTLFALMFSIIIFGLFIGIMGCSENSVGEPATILGTDPDDGSRIFAGEDLTITFDRTVASVKVNGTSADIDNTQALWDGRLEAGKQDLAIEWTDENGNVNYGAISLNVHELDLATCSGGPDCTGPDCPLP